MDLVKKQLKMREFQPSQIDEVILVGGSTRVPKVQDLVKENFWKRTSQRCKSG